MPKAPAIAMINTTILYNNTPSKVETMDKITFRGFIG